jgi:NADH-quinone oxidoreductase subunit L
MATVTLVGALTALVAALMAFTRTHKKVLAYSTVSQLGFMFIGVGAGVFWAGILHLVTHAFFKACLFLGAGSVMHGMGDDTDIRNMGGLWKKMPSTAWTFAIATAAITGVVPLSASSPRTPSSTACTGSTTRRRSGSDRRPTGSAPRPRWARPST